MSVNSQKDAKRLISLLSDRTFTCKTFQMKSLSFTPSEFNQNFIFEKKICNPKHRWGSEIRRSIAWCYVMMYDDDAKSSAFWCVCVCGWINGVWIITEMEDSESCESDSWMTKHAWEAEMATMFFPLNNNTIHSLTMKICCLQGWNPKWEWRVCWNT